MRKIAKIYVDFSEKLNFKMSTIGPDQQIKLKLLHFLYGHFPLFVATARFSIFFAISIYSLQLFVGP